MNRRTFIVYGSAAGISFLPGFGALGTGRGGVPKVLIIGDSISIGYTPFVREMLQNRAMVEHSPGNARNTGYALERIHGWLGHMPWDVIHFNWGLWDLCYRNPDSTEHGNRDKTNGTLTHTIREYRKNLHQLVEMLTDTGACLLWANTTPVPPGDPGRYDGDALKYNRAALKIMQKHNIRVNDLHGLMAPNMERHQVRYGDVHFTEEGYRLLARQVADFIGTCIGSL